MLHDVQEVGLEELSPRLVERKLLQQGQEDVEANVCHVSHGVLEGPDNGVHEELELRRRDQEVGWREEVMEPELTFGSGR